MCPVPPPSQAYLVLEELGPGGAETVIHAAIAPEYNDPEKVPLFLHDCKPMTPLAASHDEKNGKLLWDWSEKMVGLSNQMRTSGTPMFTLECLIAHTYTCRAYWQFALGQI
eukprot:1145437-Pelagomonas_calceolata.AAC.5